MLAGAVLKRGSSLSHTPHFRCSFQGASPSCRGGKCNLGSGCQLWLGIYLFCRICLSLGSSCPRFRQTICIWYVSSERSSVMQRCEVWGSWVPGEDGRFLWPPCRVCLLAWVQSGIKQDVLWPATVTVTHLCSNLCSLGWGLAWPLFLVHDV